MAFLGFFFRSSVIQWRIVATWLMYFFPEEAMYSDSRSMYRSH